LLEHREINSSSPVDCSHVFRIAPRSGLGRAKLVTGCAREQKQLDVHAVDDIDEPRVDEGASNGWCKAPGCINSQKKTFGIARHSLCTTPAPPRCNLKSPYISGVLI
jgi:hypothetical protein